MNARSSIWAVILVASVTACGGGGKSSDAPPPKPKAVPKDTPQGLDLRLSNGKSGAPAYDRAQLAPATKLADAETAQLLSRAKPIVPDPADQSAFAIRPSSQPPPRTGQVITGTFPPPPSASLPPPVPSPKDEPLDVLRFMPEGKVPIAPELSITFNKPMVAVTSQEDAARVQPVKLEPQPKGNWRWIGTRTILFDPDVRFPQSTTYKVTIAAGTKAATGETLVASRSFSFETPPPKLVSSSPSGGPQQLDVPIFLLFDQRIDQKAVLAKLVVKANGSARATRLVTDAEIEKSYELKSLVAAAKADEQAGRWIAVRTKDKLPPDAQIDVELPAGTPSAEGPNKTTELQKITFRTYPPLTVIEAECGWGGRQGCRPGTPLRIELSNPLDTDAFDPKQVTITPPIPNVRVSPSGSTVWITGMKQPRTSYAVTLSGSIKDVFAQKLNRDDRRTFLVGDLETEFHGPRDMVVLDPAAKGRTLDFFTTSYSSLKARIYKVTPADYAKWIDYMDNRWRKDKPPVMPGTKVFDGAAQVKGTGILAETNLDLSAALDGGFGHAIAIVNPSPWNETSPPPELISWVQATRLGIDAHVDGQKLYAYASELETGAPAAGVDVVIQPEGISGKTDATGMATLALPTSREPRARILIARRDKDTAFLTERDNTWGGGQWVQDTSSGGALNAYVTDDRRLYRPGEEVSIKGWLRFIDQHMGGDVGGVEGKITGLTYVAHDSNSIEIARGTVPVSALGGFEAKLVLPKTPNLGYARMEFSPTGPAARPEMGFSHGFRVEEFRRPEFEVNARPSDGPFLVGGGGDMTVSAKYFTGAALPGAQVTWTVNASTTSYTPPNRDDYSFGTWTPWWGGRRSYDGDFGGYDDDESYYAGRYRMGGIGNRGRASWSHAGKTDAVGDHVLHFDFLSANPSVPMSVSATATVTDVNRQAWSASTSLVVHPASLYVGLKAPKPFVEPGQPFELDVIGVDIDGKIAAGTKIALTSVRLDWQYEKGDYKQKEVDPQQCAVTIASDAGHCTFGTAKGGEYKVTATIVDKEGRQNQSTLNYTVAGAEGPPSRDVKQETVTLIPDKKEYSPGNTAEVLIQSPFYPAEGLVTWRRSGIVKMQRITLDKSTKVITVPIEDGMTPNLIVHVDLVGAATRTDDKGMPATTQPKRPAFAVGELDLPIPPRHRTLSIVVTPESAKVAPAAKTSVAFEIKDAAGKPVANAEAAVIVVDEAVLALASASFGNPVDTFHVSRSAGAFDRFSRAKVTLTRPPSVQTASDDPPPPEEEDKPDDGYDESGGTGTAMALEEGKMGKKDSDRAEGQYKMRRASVEDARNAGILGGVKQKNGGAFASLTGEPEPNTPIAVRTNFNPLAAFAGAVKTDGSGKATVAVTMPDNLTRYRIIVLAVAGEKQFGKGESAVTARLPLMIKPSAPRFLNFGDTFQLPIVVQNQTDAPMTVKVAIAATNLSLTDGTGRSVTVPANDRVEVQFPAAAELAGTARLSVVGSAGQNSDAAEISIPVWTPATTEAFATYGVIDDGAMAQPIALPGKVVQTYGGLEITTASTNLQALTDAMLYLVHYPFDCAEQRSSRILAIAALRDVLESFKVKDMPSRGQMEASIAADLEHLSQMQNGDGGFAYWERGYKSEPYLTVHVAHALARAKAKGYAVPQVMIDRARGYLREIETHYESYYGVEVSRSISAYALYVRKQIGDVDVPKAQKLIADAGGVDKIEIETLGWLLSTITGNPAAKAERDAIVRRAMNSVSETAGAANFTTSYGDGAYLLLASDQRDDAVMLEALIQETPQSDVIPKLVTGLLAHRKAGRWISTQESTFALLALDLYFRTYEKVTPNFIARVWLGNDYAGDLAFRGRSTKYFQINVPMQTVATHDNQSLTIQKDGPGRLYYRLGMRYAPASLKLDAADYGFVVERRYEGVDNKTDVTRAPDGVWHIKAGARVRVRISLVNENRRYHVALVDPLPAGLEILNPELAGQAPVPPSGTGDDEESDESSSRGGRYWWWYGPWYEHQNLRDERAEAFTQLLYEGVHKYDYVTRATTPGNFVVPPPKAEEMYMPETFGRGASDRVVVE